MSKIFHISILLSLGIILAGCQLSEPNAEQVLIEEQVLESSGQVIPPLHQVSESQSTKYCDHFGSYQFDHPINWRNYRFENLRGYGYNAFLSDSRSSQSDKPAIGVLVSEQPIPKPIEKILESSTVQLANTTAQSYKLAQSQRIITQNHIGHIQIDLLNFQAEHAEIKQRFFDSFTFNQNLEACYTPNSKTQVIDNTSYSANQKVAQIDGQNLTFTHDKYAYSIPNASLQLISQHPFMPGTYSYQGLRINLPSPKAKNIPVTYECTSSLLPNKPYFDCQTNGKEYLTQYEFSEDYRQFTTGGGYPFKWKKIYIKRINGIDIIFEGDLAADSYWITDDPPKSQIDRIESKEYLDYARALPVNQYNDKLWTQVIDSFTVTSLEPTSMQAGTYALDNFSFQYDPNLILTEHADKSIQIQLTTQPPEGHLPALSGFNNRDMQVELTVYPDLKVGEWLDIAKRPGASIGTVLKQGYTKLNGVRGYELIQEGMGFMQEYDQAQKHHTFFFPSPDSSQVLEITLYTAQSNYPQALKQLNQIVSSFQWNNPSQIVSKASQQFDTLVEGSSGLRYFNQVDFHDFPTLRLSFYYHGNQASYIKSDGSRLQYIHYYPHTDTYQPNPDDFIEIYPKNHSDDFQTAITNLLTKQNINFEDCDIRIQKDDNGLRAYLDYQIPFEYDQSKCLTTDEGPACHTRQIQSHDKLALSKCSPFEASSFKNYFLYQPSNNRRHIIFLRHISGLDARPWLEETIRL